MGFLAFGQEDVIVPSFGKVSDFDDGKKLGGVKVTILAGGSTVATVTTASNGKYEYDLKAGKIYKFQYSKSGYVTKVVQVDLTGINAEDVPAGNVIQTPPFDIDLFKDRPNVDFSFLKTQPVAEFYYDRGMMRLNYDAKKASVVKKKIDDLLNQADKKQKDTEARYAQLIEQADKLSEEERYEEALVQYEQALNLKPQEAYPSERIVALEDLISAMKKQKMQEEQANSAYNNLISAAQNFMSSGEYDKAIDKYYEAAELKPNDEYAQTQIDKAYDLKKKAENKKLYDEAVKLADMYLKQNSTKAALDKYKEANLLDPTQEYPKKQIAALEKDVEEQQQAKLNKQKYDALIVVADKLFVDQKWTEAKAKYNEALTLIANDDHATKRIAEIDAELKRIEEEKAKEEAYKKVIAEADAAFGKKEWDPATEKYNEALTIKPDDAYAKGKLNDISAQKKAEEEAAKQKEIDANFAALIAEGETLQAENKLQEAKAKYTAAKEVKADPLADQKIAEVDALIAQASAAAEKDKQIAELLASANGKLEAEKFQESIVDYDKVLALDGENQEAQTKKAEAQAGLKAKEDAEAKAAEIAQLKQEGATALEGKDYATAITKYKAVLAIVPNDTEAQTKITEAENAQKALADQAALDKSYTDKIAAADQARDAEELDKAIALYQEAQGIKSEETYPAQEIEKLEIKKKELAAAADQAKVDAAYQEKITAAATAKDKEQYELALILFGEAKEMKPSEVLPQQQIDEINALVAAQKADADAAALKAAYDAKITEAENAKSAEQYDEAIALFTAAKEIKSDESYPDTQIEVIKELKRKAELAKKAEAVQAEFDKKMQAGMTAKEGGSYQEALALFKAAKALKEDELEPQNQINEINALLAEQDAAAQEKALNDAYTAKVEAGDEAFKAEEFTKALNLYIEARDLKPNEDYPEEQITAINRLLQEKDAEAKEAKIQAEFDAKFEEAMKAKGEEDYNTALAKLNEAKAILNDKKAQKEIDEINGILADKEKAKNAASEAYQAAIAKADQLRDEENYDKAIAAYQEAITLNPSDNYPQQEISKIEAKKVELAAAQNQAALDAKFNDKMEAANKARDKEQFEVAIMLYGEAQEIKPTAPEPKAEIQAINDLIASRANAEEAEARKVAYQAKISEADKARNKEDYENAISLYQQASEIDPAQDYPKSQIAEINAVIAETASQKAEAEKAAAYQAKVDAADKAFDKDELNSALALYQEASEIDPSQAHPKERIEQINAAIAKAQGEKAAAEEQKAFESAITKANTLFDNKDYAQSITAYEAALEIRDDSFATSQIAKAKAAQLAAENDAQQNALNSAINNADVAFKNKKFEESISLYKKVLTLDGGNQKAKDRIAEAQQILDNQEKQAAASKEQQEKYNNAIAKADALYNAGDLTQAKLNYQQAVKIKSNDRYASGRIKEIENQLRDQVANEKEANYRKLITTADNYFKGGNLEKAKELYTRANSLNPRDGYPKKQLDIIEAKLNGVEEETGPLKNLGTEEEISLEEGARMLLEAEQTREQNRRNVIQQEVEATEALPTELALGDREERRQTQEEADELVEEVVEGNAEADKARLEIVEEVKQREDDLAKKSEREQMLETAESYRTQEDIDAIQTEVTETADQKKQDLQAMTEDLNEQEQIAQAKQMKDAAESVDRTQVTYEFIEDELEKQAVNGDAEAQVVAAQKILEEINEQEATQYETTVENQAILEAKSLLAEEQAEKARAQRQAEEDEQAQVIDRTVKMAEDASEARSEQARAGDLLHQEVSGEVDQRQDALAAKKVEDGAKERQEELNTARVIEGAEDVRKQENEKQNEAHANKQQQVEESEDQVQRAGALKKEEDQRKQTQTVQTLEEQDNQNSQDAAEKSKEAQELNQEIVASLDQTNESRSEKAESKKQSAQDVQNFLDGLENNTSQYSETVANTLGEEFPEGVTQQNFVRRDSEGLPVKIVTRRIVVVNGRGDVYIRIQTKFGTTYSKNGTQVTSTVWDKETDNGKLVKHF